MLISLIPYNYGEYNDCYDVFNVRVNTASLMFSLTLLAIKRLHCPTLPKWHYWSSWSVNGQLTCSLPHPKNDRQLSAKNVGPCILANPRAVQRHWPTINVLAAVLGKNAFMDIATISSEWSSQEHQRWGFCKVDNPQAAHRHYPIIEVFAAIMGKNGSEDSTTTSKK